MKAILVRILSTVLAMAVLTPAAPASAAGASDPAAVAHRALTAVPLIDGHNDLPWQYGLRVQNRLSDLDISRDQSALDPPLHTDIPRLRKGKVGAQFWSVYVSVELPGAEAVQATVEQIDLVHRLVSRHPDTFVMVSTADDIERAHRAGRIASLIGVEGGHSINNSLAVLRQLYALGARSMTLTHSTSTEWADSATDAPKLNGLSEFGGQVVLEMNRLGMLVDISHVSHATMSEVLDVSRAPVVFTHSSARALANHPRNVPDDILRRLPGNGGIVMVMFYPPFVSEAARLHDAATEGEKAKLERLHRGDPAAAERALAAWKKEHPAPAATIAQIANHIDHIRKVAGIDHIGIGGDLDGISTTPRDFRSVADYPALFTELARRGYSQGDLEKIAGRNVLRAMRSAEQVARKLQQEQTPSEATAAPATP